jgi:DNA repair exonuclease SbcCD ATPase subunit
MARRDFLIESRSFVKTAIDARDEILNRIEERKKEREKLVDVISSLEEARLVVSNEISSIQSSLKEDIDSLVTIALQIVYEDRDIQFGLLFNKTKTGVSQYKPVIIENEEEFSPKEEQCGGALDVISYALRIILHSFEKPKGRDFMIFDEPFKFLGGGVLGEKAAEMAKRINEEIGIQSMIISHDEISIGKAEKVYHIQHNGKRSSTTLLGGQKRVERRL